MTQIEDKLDQILGKLQKLDDLDEKVDKLNSSLRKEIDEIKVEISHLKQESSNKDRRNEERDRKFNLLLFGVGSKELFTMNQEVINILRFLVPDFNGNFIRELWKTNRNKENSPIIVKFNSLITKNTILRGKSKLQEKQEFKNIQIKEDFSVETRAIRKELFPHLLSLKKEGRKVIMIGDKLRVDGTLLSLEELQKQESNSSKRARSEEASPSPKQGECKDSRDRQTKKKGKKFNENNSLERFLTKNIDKTKEEDRQNEQSEAKRKEDSRSEETKNQDE
ncbi:hypothetical protein LSTR_LSTR012120 [Laodelphax striatellus]|uniref:L1 transposable element RRM domain-containing protein n=1 Tax=Laodelphax striatellus TaxID=195883 RepID=A0A482WXW7_LAOST|nr:hypothetical protein LSTR_LSTR012120 [Laodelphax striatellus]